MNASKINTTRGISLPILTIVVIFVLIIGTVIILDRKVSEQADVQKELRPAPELTLQDYSGNTVRLSDSLGKVQIVNSWATWCPFCVDELPDFVTLQEEFGDDIVVFAINREESLNRAKGYTDDLNLTDSLIFLLDPDDNFHRQTGGIGMPVTLFVNIDGNIVITKRGPMSLEEMREKTLQVLDR